MWTNQNHNTAEFHTYLSRLYMKNFPAQDLEYFFQINQSEEKNIKSEASTMFVTR